MVTKKKWIYADTKKLAGLEKDVETSMIILILNIGKRIQEETEEAKRIRKEDKTKINHICSDYLLTKLIW